MQFIQSGSIAKRQVLIACDIYCMGGMFLPVIISSEDANFLQVLYLWWLTWDRYVVPSGSTVQPASAARDLSTSLMSARGGKLYPPYLRSPAKILVVMARRCRSRSFVFSFSLALSLAMLLHSGSSLPSSSCISHLTSVWTGPEKRSCQELTLFFTFSTNHALDMQVAIIKKILLRNFVRYLHLSSTSPSDDETELCIRRLLPEIESQHHSENVLEWSCPSVHKKMSEKSVSADKQWLTDSLVLTNNLAVQSSTSSTGSTVMGSVRAPSTDHIPKCSACLHKNTGCLGKRRHRRCSIFYKWSAAPKW